MAVLPDFEYDIFISYRHNDNRSGWVTEFVNALQEELAATIKEPLTIYFDKNPHDGLLETHHVDKSLEGKLKCLILIPIISQTYCDTKSFAWQHEFVAFNKMAIEASPFSSKKSLDHFPSPFGEGGQRPDEVEGLGMRLGRDIKLANGNFASRILPIKIHDLDAEDKAIIENEIGGALRAIEFIYKEAGVNRPLKSTDSKNDNQNKTDYRNQVNKVANAIKEIINAIKNPSSTSSTITSNGQSITANTQTSIRKKAIITSLLALLIAVIGYFIYQQTTSNLPTGQAGEQPTQLEKSIAVLPFADLSPTHDQEYFGDGMAEAIINGLGQVSNLKVIARSSSFQFKDKNESLLAIGKILNVATALEGSVTKSGSRIRVRATLTKTEDGTQLWSETFDRNLDDYLLIQDEITSKIVGALKISFSGQLRPSQRLSTSGEAMKLYQQGRYFHDRNSEDDPEIASDYFSRAVKIDSGFALAWAYMSTAQLFDLSKGEQYNARALKIDPNLADAHINAAIISWSHGNFIQVEKDVRRALSIESENPRVLRNAGRNLSYLGFYQEGLELCKKAVELDPLQSFAHLSLTHAFALNGQFGEALDAWKREKEISNRNSVSTLAHLLVLNGQAKEALPLVDKISDEKDRLFLMTVISFALNQKTKADEYFNKFRNKYSTANPQNVSEILVIYGQKEEALKTLEKVVKPTVLNFPSVDKWFDSGLFIMASPYLIPLRDDPKFKEICKKLNYPEIK